MRYTNQPVTMLQ